MTTTPSARNAKKSVTGHARWKRSHRIVGVLEIRIPKAGRSFWRALRKCQELNESVLPPWSNFVVLTLRPRRQVNADLLEVMRIIAAKRRKIFEKWAGVKAKGELD